MYTQNLFALQYPERKEVEKKHNKRLTGHLKQQLIRVKEEKLIARGKQARGQIFQKSQGQRETQNSP